MTKLLYETMIRNPQPNKPVMKYLDKAEVVDIGNVSEYFFEVSNQEEWDILKDYPNLAPPFEYFFMEYSIPKFTNNEGKLHLSGLYEIGVRKIGVLLFGMDISQNDDAERETWRNMGIKWSLILHPFVLHADNSIIELLYGFMLGINKDGSVNPMDGKPVMGFCQKNIPELNNALQDVLDNGFAAMFGPVFLAISFMHCKNVELIKMGQGQKRGRRNRHGPHIKYHILKIEPMKKILRTEGKSEEVGIRRALHICRGHFKDFRDGKGLFGKYKDIYWWDSQVRGNIENGIVNKDYLVDYPKDKNITSTNHT